MYSEATLIGRIGNDLDLKKVGQNHTSFVTFNLAVSAKKNETHWFRVKAFGKWAEVISQFYKKGDQIFVKATPSTFAYKSKTGQEVTGVEFIGNYFRGLGGGKREESTSSSVEAPVFENSESITSSVTEDNIPF